MPITIRPALLTDLPTFLLLDREIFGWYGGEEEPVVIAARLAVFPAGCAVVELQEDSETLVAGYLTSEKWDSVREPALNEDPHDTHRPDGTVLNVTTFAIAADFQNQGLGQQLLDYTFDLARRQGCLEIVLETAHAQKFYLRHGFELVGERDERGYALYVLKKVLSPECLS